MCVSKIHMQCHMQRMFTHVFVFNYLPDKRHNTPQALLRHCRAWASDASEVAKVQSMQGGD